MKKLGNYIQQIWAVDYSVKTAKFLVRMWGLVLIFSMINVAILVIFPEEAQWGAVALQAGTLIIDAVMFRHSLGKLARAKNAAWVRSMYLEWSRLS